MVATVLVATVVLERVDGDVMEDAKSFADVKLWLLSVFTLLTVQRGCGWCERMLGRTVYLLIARLRKK